MQQLPSKTRRCLFRSDIMVLHHVVFSFVCLFVCWFCFSLFIFGIANIFRSFVVSLQTEFAVFFNKSLATFNTTHKLYVTRFMCRSYVIRSIHILYVIRFLYKLYVIRSMYRICGIRFVHKLSFGLLVY